jgi:hypothetical protein
VLTSSVARKPNRSQIGPKRSELISIPRFMNKKSLPASSFSKPIAPKSAGSSEPSEDITVPKTNAPAKIESVSAGNLSAAVFIPASISVLCSFQ